MSTKMNKVGHLIIALVSALMGTTLAVIGFVICYRDLGKVALFVKGSMWLLIADYPMDFVKVLIMSIISIVLLTVSRVSAKKLNSIY